MGIVAINVSFQKCRLPTARARAAGVFRARANRRSLGPRFVWTAPADGARQSQRVCFDVEGLDVADAFPAFEKRVLALAARCQADADKGGGSRLRRLAPGVLVALILGVTAFASVDTSLLDDSGRRQVETYATAY